MTLLPVDAAEFGREFFGVERLDVSGVLPRRVALRAITCICSFERAIFVAGRRRSDAAGAALRRGAAWRPGWARWWPWRLEGRLGQR